MRLIFAILTGFTILTSGAAMAQSRCGDVHAVEPEQDLFEIAQTCRVSLARIHALNPGLDAKDMPEPGAEVRLAPRRGARDADSGLPATYRVEEGDTAASIARSLGITLLELLHRNGDLDPLAIEPGDVLEVPDEDRGAAVFVQPLAAPPGTEVIVRAETLRAGDYVTIGAGHSAASWTPIREARIAEDGRLDAAVRVPDDAMPGDILTFFVDTDRGATLKSRDFDVLDPDAPRGGAIKVEGRIRRGVECPTLTTPDGDLYSLVSGDRQLLPGDYVQIAGQSGNMAACEQGIATIDVSSLTKIRAPGNLPRNTAAPNPNEVLGAWIAKGGDCGSPAFRIERDGDRLTVETSVDGSPQSGRVAFAGDTTYLSFEMPFNELGLERRGEGELAVIAPAGTTATLGNVEIEGDGQIFVRCFG